MTKKICLFFLTSTIAQKTYEYNDIFDYLSGNITIDDYFDEKEEIRPIYENSSEETLPKIFGYASLSVSENVKIIVPQIVSEIQKLDNINKKMRTPDLPTFLVDLFSDPTYKIEDPYIEELVQKILEKLRETGVDPVTILPNLRYSRCPIYWVPVKESQQCIPSSYLYKVSIKISIKHESFYLTNIFNLILKVTCLPSGGSIFLDDSILSAFGLDWKVQLNDNSCAAETTQERAFKNKKVYN